MTDTSAPAVPAAPAAASPADPAAVATAVVLATAPAADGGPAALLPWEGGTLLGRLLGQLAALGVADVRLVTRPAWEEDVRAAGADGARLLVCPAAADDLRAVAEVAGEAGGGLVVLPADVVTHGEALAGLLKDPRIATGVLIGGGWQARQFAFRLRARRGRVLSAGSPYHAVFKPTASFLGVVKVAARDRPALAEAAAALAPLAAAPPEEWQEELARKEDRWRMVLWRAANSEPPSAEQDGDSEDEPAEDVEDDDEALDADEPAPEDVELSAEDEARLRERVTAAPEDVPAMLLVGLVRGGTHVGVSHLRKLYWARPLSPAAARAAGERIGDYDEDRVLLDSAVKASDGFFTTFLVSPYSRHIARWAARRGFTPNQVTTVSLLIGLLAAAAFATGERWGLIAGAVLLQAAFTTDCVDGQLARYTRTFSKFGAWLDSIFDRSKEYLAFAGLAIGASRMGDPVWLLACAAITLQTVKHLSDFSFGAGQTQVIGATPQPPVERSRDARGLAAAERRARAEVAAAEAAARGEAPAGGGPASGAAAPAPPVRRSLPRRLLRLWHAVDRLPGVRWVKKMVAFPIGERFAVISLTAALFDPRVTFVVLLAWGGVAATYTLAGRILRSVAR